MDSNKEQALKNDLLDEVTGGTEVGWADEEHCPKCGSTNCRFIRNEGIYMVYKCEDCGFIFKAMN